MKLMRLGTYGVAGVVLLLLGCQSLTTQSDPPTEEMGEDPSLFVRRGPNIPFNLVKRAEWKEWPDTLRFAPFSLGKIVYPKPPLFGRLLVFDIKAQQISSVALTGPPDQGKDSLGGAKFVVTPDGRIVGLWESFQKIGSENEPSVPCNCCVSCTAEELESGAPIPVSGWWEDDSPVWSTAIAVPFLEPEAPGIREVYWAHTGWFRGKHRTDAIGSPCDQLGVFRLTYADRNGIRPKEAPVLIYVEKNLGVVGSDFSTALVGNVLHVAYTDTQIRPLLLGGDTYTKHMMINVKTRKKISMDILHSAFVRERRGNTKTYILPRKQGTAISIYFVNHVGKSYFLYRYDYPERRKYRICEMNAASFLPVAVNSDGWHILFTESMDPSRPSKPVEDRWLHACLISTDGKRSAWETVPPEAKHPGADQSNVVTGKWKDGVIYIGEMTQAEAFTYEYGKK